MCAVSVYGRKKKQLDSNNLKDFKDAKQNMTKQPEVNKRPDNKEMKQRDIKELPFL